MSYPAKIRKQVISKAIDFADTKYGAIPIYPHNSGQRKLTFEQANEIRRRAASGEKQVDIAREYGVSQGTISGIVRGERYKSSAAQKIES